MNKLYSDETELFFDCILALENKEECYKFFEDICTFKEIDAIAQRVKVAKMIKEFAQINLKAAKLQIPYLLWCIFAAAINFGVWWLNR